MTGELFNTGEFLAKALQKKFNLKPKATIDIEGKPVVSGQYHKRVNTIGFIMKQKKIGFIARVDGGYDVTKAKDDK